jgi:hypothetical protein
MQGSSVIIVITEDTKIRLSFPYETDILLLSTVSRFRSLPIVHRINLSRPWCHHEPPFTVETEERLEPHLHKNFKYRSRFRYQALILQEASDIIEFCINKKA